MHSAWVMVLRRCVEWENVDNMVPPNATKRTAVIIEPFGTDESVPYAKHNISRFNEPR